MSSAEIIAIVSEAGSKNKLLYQFLKPWLSKLVIALECKHKWINAGMLCMSKWICTHVSQLMFAVCDVIFKLNVYDV